MPQKLRFVISAHMAAAAMYLGLFLNLVIVQNGWVWAIPAVCEFPLLLLFLNILSERDFRIWMYVLITVFFCILILERLLFLEVTGIVLLISAVPLVIGGWAIIDLYEEYK